MSLILPAVICAGTVFLLLAGENVSRWMRGRIQPAKADDRAWIDQRIAAEPDPARRAAWRLIRNQPYDLPEGDRR